jgi:hypothetical protein
MARKSRTAVLKRQREVKKAEKAAQKREKREAREAAPPQTRVATSDDLADYGFSTEETSDSEDSESPPDPTRRAVRGSGDLRPKAPDRRRLALGPSPPQRRFPWPMNR